MNSYVETNAKKCLKSSGRNITINFYAIILYSIYYLLLF